MRVLLLLRGSAGCGKSTWIEQNGLKPYTLSADDIRLLCQSPVLQVDIYALGVLLNIMLTGEHPSRKLASGRMGRIVQRCTMVNPEKRYKNILHLMEVL